MNLISYPRKISNFSGILGEEFLNNLEALHTADYPMWELGEMWLPKLKAVLERYEKASGSHFGWIHIERLCEIDSKQFFRYRLVCRTDDKDVNLMVAKSGDNIVIYNIDELDLVYDEKKGGNTGIAQFWGINYYGDTTVEDLILIKLLFPKECLSSIRDNILNEEVFPSGARLLNWVLSEERINEYDIKSVYISERSPNSKVLKETSRLSLLRSILCVMEVKTKSYCKVLFRFFVDYCKTRNENEEEKPIFDTKVRYEADEYPM